MSIFSLKCTHITCSMGGDVYMLYGVLHKIHSYSMLQCAEKFGIYMVWFLGFKGFSVGISSKLFNRNTFVIYVFVVERSDTEMRR